MKKYVGVLIVEIIFTVFLCFLLTWLNVEEISIKYELSKLKKEYIKNKELNSKLKTEKSVLFSPHRLNVLARSLSMEPIDPSRVKKIR